jgi:hypothetical protein
MRSIVIGAVVAAGFAVAGTAPTLSAPANMTTISKAAAEINPVEKAYCWCVVRGWRGFCRVRRCR